MGWGCNPHAAVSEWVAQVVQLKWYDWSGKARKAQPYCFPVFNVLNFILFNLFFTFVAPHLVVENSNIISISDILSDDLDLPDLYVDVEQQKVTAKEQESPVDVSYAVHEDLSEDILKVLQII